VKKEVKQSNEVKKPLLQHNATVATVLSTLSTLFFFFSNECLQREKYDFYLLFFKILKKKNLKKKKLK
jgi:hypothetical protein